MLQTASLDCVSIFAQQVYRYLALEIQRFLATVDHINAPIYDRYMPPRTRAALCQQGGVYTDQPAIPAPPRAGGLSLSQPSLLPGATLSAHAFVHDVPAPGAVHDCSWGASTALEQGLRDAVAEVAGLVEQGKLGLMPVTRHMMDEMQKEANKYRHRAAVTGASASVGLSGGVAADSAAHPLPVAPMGTMEGLGVRTPNQNLSQFSSNGEDWGLGAESVHTVGYGSGKDKEKDSQCVIRTSTQPGLLKDLLCGDI